ncbi:hypothetical protein JOM56_001774 [Amanita muscaria]
MTSSSSHAAASESGESDPKRRLSILHCSLSLAVSRASFVLDYRPKLLISLWAWIKSVTVTRLGSSSTVIITVPLSLTTNTFCIILLDKLSKQHNDVFDLVFSLGSFNLLILAILYILTTSYTTCN